MDPDPDLEVSLCRSVAGILDLSHQDLEALKYLVVEPALVGELGLAPALEVVEGLLLEQVLEVLEEGREDLIQLDQ